MYFSKFPLISYPSYSSTDDTRKLVAARNILRRIAMSEETKSARGAFVEYNIKDGERPEHIASRVYGNADDHWLILLANDVLDPYHDWYKSSTAMEEYVNRKYSGYSVFFTNSSDQFLYNSSFYEGCTLSQSGVSSSVIEYQPNMCKLVVGSSFNTGTATIGLTNGTQLTVKIHRVLPSYLAAHHFHMVGFTATVGPTGENGVEEIPQADPFAIQTNQYTDYSKLGGLGLGNPVTGVRTSTGASGSVALWETYIGKYMGISGSSVDIYAVSNVLHETNANESKRKIKVLHPRYADSAKREFEALLRV